MPSSNLRFQSTLSEPISTGSYFPSTFSPRSIEKKQKKMSLTQTYYIAASARSKLGREAGRSDHNLRLLVGHANLLDSLMLELANAEREQEAWFNQTVQRASHSESHSQKSALWADSIREEDESSDDEEDFSDSDSEFDDDDFAMVVPHTSSPRLPAVTVTSAEIDEEEDSDDEFFYDEEDDAEHALVRTASIPPQSSASSSSAPLSPPASPPELVSDDSLSSSEDDLSESEEEHTSILSIPPYSPARKQAAGLSASEQEQLASNQELYSQQRTVIASF